MQISPLTLTLEDVAKIVPNPGDIYYRSGAIFITTKQKLLKCNLTPSQKASVMAFPEVGGIKMRTTEVGTFNIDL
jgi:hypothetical protein